MVEINVMCAHVGEGRKESGKRGCVKRERELIGVAISRSQKKIPYFLLFCIYIEDQGWRF